jgi:hypothetical protein
VGTLAFAAVLVSACSTLTPQERAAACQSTDWSNYGYNDGLLGVPATDRAKYFADCAELGHPADITAYDTARADGLTKYCTLENGYEIGYSGRSYRGVCPRHLAQSFVQGYDRGRKERPVRVYPSIGFGFGFGRFGHHNYWHGHHHHRRHRSGGAKGSER